MSKDAFTSDILALKKDLSRSGKFQPDEKLSYQQILLYCCIFILTLVAAINYLNPYLNLWSLVLSLITTISSAKIGFILHDLGHFNGFKSKRKNRLYGQSLAALLLGVDFNWWLSKHQKHHRFPQVLNQDPDLYQSLLAIRWVRNLMGSSMVFAGFFSSHILFYFQGLSIKYVWSKPFSIGFNLLLMRWLVFSILCVFSPKMLLFFYISTLLTGLILIVVFTPNHFPLERTQEIQHSKMVHQVYFSANLILPKWLTVWLGALPLQIEHHLLPELPSHQVPSIQPQIIEILKKHQLPYQQFTTFEALKGAHQQIRGMSSC